MAQETGEINDFLEPTVFIEFGGGKQVEFVIDTGFNGSLCVPRSLMEALNLTKDLQEEIFGIGLHRQILDIAISEIIWFGEKMPVNILINDGDDRLLGSQLFEGKILQINYQNKTVTISD